VTAVAIKHESGQVKYYDGVIEDITERKRTEEALRESEEKFRTLADQSPNMIFINQKGKVIYANPKCEQSTGYTREEVYAADFDFFSLVAPECHTFIRASFAKHMQGEDVPPYEYTLITKEGKKIEVILSSKLIDYKGERAILGTVTDISDRKHAEEKLRRSEEKYRELYERLRDGLAAVRMDGKIVECNSVFRQMLGYTDEEIRRLTYEDITPEKWHPIEANIIQEQVLKQGYSDLYQKEYRRKDGTVFPVELRTYLMRDKEGQPDRMWAIVRDITKRKSAEEALKFSEEKYRTIFEASPDAIILLDQGGTILNANKRLSDWLGYAPEQMIGQHVLAIPVISEQSRNIIRENFARRMSGQSVAPYEVDFIGRNGQRRIGRIQGTVLREKDGTISGDLVMVSDVTERKEAEVELQRSLERMQDLIEGVIHTISVTVEMRDQYTAGHQKRVAILARKIAQEMMLPGEKVQAIYMASLIHDIGKISIPAEILSKPTRLNEVEYSIIKTHPQVGYDILKGIEFPWPVAELVLKHHERMDGSGYPQGLGGDEIPLEARILSVADVVEAMASHRPYRAALGIGKALEEISQNKGKLYDADVVRMCLKVFYERNFGWEEE
jgi:PAS domain S-box-containing protein/putative nucleotidyltransferase with HDIG domain